MATKKGCIGRIIVTLFIIGLICAFSLLALGYAEYKTAVNEIPLAIKVGSCQQQENYVTTAQISPYFLTNIVIIEDKRFYEHGAVDIIGISRALVTDLQRMELSEGGSTITQQVAKNLYFSNNKRFVRKIAEIFVARDLENNYSKDEILELYCNIIYFGQNCYGIKEAANTYYHKEPLALTFAESVVLAGVPQSPNNYNPIDSPQKSAERSEAVMKVLERNGIREENGSENKDKAEAEEKILHHVFKEIVDNFFN